MPEQSDGIDFAVAAIRADGAWEVSPIAPSACETVEALGHALRRLSGDAGALAMVAVDEDFFVLVRSAGTTVRVLLSDVSAADEWELAQSAIDHLGLPAHEDDGEQVPAGDLDLLGDLGLPAADMGALLDETDLYPDEMLSDVARRLGFGELFDDAIGLTTA